MTGEFTIEMKEYFGAKNGAFTSFTAEEIRKGTFNVKAVIRDLLIQYLGNDNIPRAWIEEKQEIDFKVCPKGKIYGTDQVSIPCKFSKLGKKEMSIYFNRAQMAQYQEGDYWYIYFRTDSEQPVIGILSTTKWNGLFNEIEGDEMVEPDEVHNKKINYLISAPEMKFREIEPPALESVVRTVDISKSVRKSMSVDEAAVKAHNKKAKGNMGEDIAIEIEKQRLKLIAREDLISKITHVAKYRDGLGYDIISADVDSDGDVHEIYIEVKTTAGDRSMPFYVSLNELNVSQKYRELYYIYRICNLKEDSEFVDYYKLNGALDETCELKPMDYIAVPKSGNMS